MTLYYIYTLCFFALCGYGIVFLNHESILAVCFFIFLALLCRYGHSAGSSLENTRCAMFDELSRCMIQSQETAAAEMRAALHQKKRLLNAPRIIKH